MKAYGYRRDDDTQDEPVELREVSFACTPEGLAGLLAFFAHVRAEIERRGPGSVAPCHFHLRDWHRGWSGADADVILAVGFEPAAGTAERDPDVDSAE